MRIIVDDQKLISLEIFIQSKEDKLVRFVKSEDVPFLEKALMDSGMALYAFDFQDKEKILSLTYQIINIYPEGYHENIYYFSEETADYQ